jgi:hypothetical protein
MLAAASNPIIAHASAWIAIAMLLAQSPPAASCGCDDSISTVRREVVQSSTTCCSKTEAASCCAKRTKSTCCSKDKRSSCCGKDHSVIGQTSCCCGNTCNCAAEPVPTQNPAVPVPQEDNRQQRQEVVTLSPLAGAAIVCSCSITPRLGHFRQVSPGTALDRCIELSRFTC